MPDPLIDNPPVEDPPVEDPPVEDPPVEDPPVEDPPVEPEKEGDTLFGDDPPKESEEGIASRPEYIPEKFWNTETGEPLIEALAKSEDYWRSHYQKLMNDDSGVPEDVSGYLKGRFNEDGDYFSGEGETLQIIPKDDPILKAHLEGALALGLSPKQADGYWDMMTVAINALGEGNQVDKKAEIAKLGEHAKVRHDGASVFMDGLNLPKEDIAVLKTQMLNSAQGIKIMEALMAESGQLSIPLGTATVTTTHQELVAEWEKLGDDPEALDNNPTKRARYEFLGKKLHPDTNEG